MKALAQNIVHLITEQSDGGEGGDNPSFQTAQITTAELEQDAQKGWHL